MHKDSGKELNINNMRFAIFIIVCLSLHKENRIKSFFAASYSPGKDRPINDIMLHGCYFANFPDSNKNSHGKTRYAFFFYKYDIAALLDMGFLTDRQIDSLYHGNETKKQVVDFMANKFRAKANYDWGKYAIEDKRITIRIHRALSGPAYGWNILAGTIINDSTIFISSCELKKRPEYCRSNFSLNFIELN